MNARRTMKKAAVLRRLPVSVAVLALMIVVGLDEAGSAQGGAKPQTDPVAGSFTASPVQVRQRTCVGQDGGYVEFDTLHTGTSTGDPRLTGEIEFTLRLLLNATTGFGTSDGRFTVRDPLSGRKKAQGEFHAVVTAGSVTHGFILGRVLTRVPAPMRSCSEVATSLPTSSRFSMRA